jgi:hypothetical protein
MIHLRCINDFDCLTWDVFLHFLYGISLSESGFFPFFGGIIAPRGQGFIMRDVLGCLCVQGYLDRRYVMMSDIPPTLQDRLKPLFFQKDMYADKLCQTGKDIRRVQLELMAGPSKETLLRSQRLIDETKYLTAKLRALEREIDGVLTQEMLVLEGEKVEG